MVSRQPCSHERQHDDATAALILRLLQVPGSRLRFHLVWLGLKGDWPYLRKARVHTSCAEHVCQQPACTVRRPVYFLDLLRIENAIGARARTDLVRKHVHARIPALLARLYIAAPCMMCRTGSTCPRRLLGEESAQDHCLTSMIGCHGSFCLTVRTHDAYIQIRATRSTSALELTWRLQL